MTRRSPLLDYAAYLVVRLAICLMQILTDRAACGFAGLLGWLAYHAGLADEDPTRDRLVGRRVLTDDEQDSTPSSAAAPLRSRLADAPLRSLGR